MTKSILRALPGVEPRHRTLDITSGVADNLLYSLPEQWFAALQEAAQNWRCYPPAGFKVSMPCWLLQPVSRSSSQFGYIKTMQILKSGQWGLWDGELSVSAGNATFNRVELHRPYLALTARS